jgi:hypothetical protein
MGEDDSSVTGMRYKCTGTRDWVPIATLVSGRTKHQCYMRWLQSESHVPTVDVRVNGDEDSMPKAAVQRTYRGRLVPLPRWSGSNEEQCSNEMTLILIAPDGWTYG